MTAFGVYYYPWYNRERWTHHRRYHTSLKGEYNSSDRDVIEWQAQAIVDSGFDYVVVEAVMPGDWCYDFMMKTTDRVVEAFRNVGLSWSFMIDAFVMGDPASHSQKILRELDTYQSNGWFDGVIFAKDGHPEIFTFGAHPQTVDELQESSGSDFNYHHVVWLKHWGVPNAGDEFPVFDAFNCRVRATGEGATYRNVLIPMGPIPFWQPTEQIFCANNFATTCPGYDDLLLERKPQMAPVIRRDDGKAFCRQLSQAGASGAENILIYGWNEYFEATTIEPSSEFGDLYQKIIREYIRSS